MANLRDRGLVEVTGHRTADGLADWTLTLRDAGELTGIDRAVAGEVFGSARTVRLSELRIDPARLDAAALARLRELRLLRGPRLRRAGLRVIGYGVFLTVLLALTVGYAQLGVVLAVAGAALAAGAAGLPARTRLGSQTLRRLAASAPGDLGEFGTALAGRSLRRHGRP
ncbi:hypothetical protein [Amycolatopsis suaedae]|uniref:hypothetical protein n=1 Tax=Amycolatopsis suaedae TaxID=2510978 RepID=UPI0013EEFC87|nr:hypothetical protein [Amycolatopsis suaedae]